MIHSKPTHRLRRDLMRASLLTLSCFAALSARAIDTSWQVDGTSSWFTPSNWSPGLPSSNFEYSYVDKGKAVIASPGATGRFVRIASDNFTTGTLEISGAGTAQTSPACSSADSPSPEVRVRLTF